MKSARPALCVALMISAAQAAMKIAATMHNKGFYISHMTVRLIVKKAAAWARNKICSQKHANAVRSKNVDL